MFAFVLGLVPSLLVEEIDCKECTTCFMSIVV